VNLTRAKAGGEAHPADAAAVGARCDAKWTAIGECSRVQCFRSDSNPGWDFGVRVSIRGASGNRAAVVPHPRRRRGLSLYRERQFISKTLSEPGSLGFARDDTKKKASGGATEWERLRPDFRRTQASNEHWVLRLRWGGR